MYFYTPLNMFLPVKMSYFSTRAVRSPILPPPATIISVVLKEKRKDICQYKSSACIKKTFLNSQTFSQIFVDPAIVYCGESIIVLYFTEGRGWWFC